MSTRDTLIAQLARGKMSNDEWKDQVEAILREEAAPMAHSTTVADFVQPEEGLDVVIQLDSVEWIEANVGQSIRVVKSWDSGATVQGGLYEVKTVSTSARTLTATLISAESVPGEVVISGAKVFESSGYVMAGPRPTATVDELAEAPLGSDSSTSTEFTNGTTPWEVWPDVHFKTTAEMQGWLDENYASLVDGQRVSRIGYYSKGDGGGAEYYWDADATDAAAVGACYAPVGVATGRLKMINKGEVYPESFGARGNGVVDDTTAIVTGCTYLHSIGGGTMLLGAGKIYAVGAAITLTSLANVSIRGNGGKVLSILSESSIPMGEIFKLQGCTNISLEFMKLDHGIEDQTAISRSWTVGTDDYSIVKVLGGSNITFTNCRFDNAYKAGVSVDSTSDVYGEASFIRAQHCHVNNPYMGYEALGLWGLDSGLSWAENRWVKNFQVVGGSVNSAYTEGVDINQPTRNTILQAISFWGCYVQQATNIYREIIDVGYAEGLVIANCIIDGQMKANAGISLKTGVERPTVTGNVIRNLKHTDEFGHFILLSEVNGATVTNNTGDFAKNGVVIDANGPGDGVLIDAHNTIIAYNNFTRVHEYGFTEINQSRDESDNSSYGVLRNLKVEHNNFDARYEEGYVQSASSTTLVLNEPNASQSVKTGGGYVPTFGGTGGYAVASNVPTTSSGFGTGLLVNIISVDGSGVITEFEVADGGDLYVGGEEITITGGNGDATYTLTSGNVGQSGKPYLQFDDSLVGLTIEITIGTGVGQSRTIQAYDNATRTVTISDPGDPTPWTITPDQTSYYKIYYGKEWGMRLHNLEYATIADNHFGYFQKGGLWLFGAETRADLADVSVHDNWAYNCYGFGFVIDQGTRIDFDKNRAAKCGGGLSGCVRPGLYAPDVAGTGYDNAGEPENHFDVETTNDGVGEGLTLDVYADAAGNVTGMRVRRPGKNYAPGNVVTVSGAGNGDATYTLASEDLEPCGILLANLDYVSAGGNRASLNTNTGCFLRNVDNSSFTHNFARGGDGQEVGIKTDSACSNLRAYSNHSSAHTTADLQYAHDTYSGFQRISGGTITITSDDPHVYMLVDEESAAPDAIDSIIGGYEGQRLTLLMYDSDNTITITDGAGIRLPSNRDLTHQTDSISLIRLATVWVETSFANNA